MENEIRTESYTYCRIYPIKCDNLEKGDFCKLYEVKLIGGYAELSTGIEEYFVERCDKCQEEN